MTSYVPTGSRIEYVPSAAVVVDAPSGWTVIVAPATGLLVTESVTVPWSVPVGCDVHVGNLKFPIRVRQLKLEVVW